MRPYEFLPPDFFNFKRRDFSGVVVVISSNVEQVYPFQVLLPAQDTGLDRDAKAQAEQVRSVAIERIGNRLGVVPNAMMLKIDEALRLHLAL